MTSQLSSIEPSHAMKQSSTTHGTSSKSPVSPKFNIDYVIKEFVREYYTIMINDPEKLHCFYEKQSSVLHCDEGDLETAVAMGIDDIKSHISRQSYQGVSVNISHYDGQYSMNDGIMVFVLGYMTFKGEKKHRFAQTFLLSETASGYFVLNDIRRLLNGSSCPTKPFSIKSGDNKPVFMKREEFTKLETTIVAPVIKSTTAKEEEKPPKKTIPVVIKKKEEASSAAAVVAPKKKDEVSAAAPAVVESIIASSTKTTSWANMASNSGSSANVVVMKSEVVSPSPSPSTSTDIAAKKMKEKKISDKTIKKRKENYLHSVYVSKVPSLYSQTSNESGRAEVVALFEKWGDLQNIEFVRNGVMFVEYVTREACLAALAASDKGYYVLGEEKIPFKVDIRRTPEERKR